MFATGTTGLPAEALQLTEDIGTLLSLCVWFIFGRAVDPVVGAGVSGAVVAYAVGGPAD